MLLLHVAAVGPLLWLCTMPSLGRPRTSLRWTAAVACAATLAAAPGVSASPRDDGPGLYDRSGYVHISPGVLVAPLLGDLRMSYVWGVAVGYHRPLERGRAIQIGGFFEHGVHVRGQDPPHLFRLGPELRAGGGTARTFGYGLVRSALALTQSDVYAQPPGSATTQARVLEPSFLLTLGGGLQGLIRRRFLLGFEPAVDLNIRDDFVPMFRARVFAGFAF